MLVVTIILPYPHFLQAVLTFWLAFVLPTIPATTANYTILKPKSQNKYTYENIVEK